MTRRLLITLAATLAACGERATLPPDLFPQTVSGVWSRTELRDLPVDESPDPVPRNSVVQIRTAAYKGPGELEARVYLLDSSEVGAAFGTRWRPSADTVFFNHGPYFVVIKWQSPDRKSLQEFVAELQKKLGAAAVKR
ncbi:MAG: hypothetical protein ABSG03_13805 [Bryobacteraceae bacterium]|jgi:hypothetical protein